MFIWNDTVALGDTLCTFPGTLQLARQEPSGIYWTNAAVGDLFPHEKYGITRLESWHPDSLRISMHDAVHYGPRHHAKHGHPTAFFMAHVGFPELSDAPIVPELDLPGIGVPDFDIVIAPYVLADIARFWPMNRWQQVVTAFSGLRIAVIGSVRAIPDRELVKIKLGRNADEYHVYRREQFLKRLTGVVEIFDQPLSEVAEILKRARLTITVDSGPARLKHAVGGKHLLLAHTSPRVPATAEWCGYPGVRMLFGDLQSFEAQHVIDIARDMLAN